MPKSTKKILIKTFKIIGMTLATVLLLMFLLPILFPDKIAREVKSFANRKLNGELNFKEAHLSFFIIFLRLL